MNTETGKADSGRSSQANGSVTLTVREIADLARFAGLELDETKLPNEHEGEDEITITDCPPGGLADEDEEVFSYFRKIAYFSEYPEEGAMGLGPESQNNKLRDAANG